MSLEALRDKPILENVVGKYPEIQKRIYILSNLMHEIGDINGYTSPLWEKAWRNEGTPEAQRFWQEYLTRPFDRIVKEGFWACSDVATTYVTLARGLSLDAHYVSAVSSEWASGTQIEDPNQHAFVEIRSENERSLIYEPFESKPKAIIMRTEKGFDMFVSKRKEGGGQSYEEIVLRSTDPINDWDEVVSEAYNALGFIRWREDGDPKGIGVNGLTDMIAQVKKDFSAQAQSISSDYSKKS